MTQECLDQNLLTLSDGSTRFMINQEMKLPTPYVQLPTGIVCEHCVLQWHYSAGNELQNDWNIITLNMMQIRQCQFKPYNFDR